MTTPVTDDRLRELVAATIGRDTKAALLELQQRRALDQTHVLVPSSVDLLRKTRRACLRLSETTGREYDEARAELIDLILGHEYDAMLAARQAAESGDG